MLRVGWLQAGTGVFILACAVILPTAQSRIATFAACPPHVAAVVIYRRVLRAPTGEASRERYE